MDNKDFRDDLSQSGADRKTANGGTDTNTTIDTEYSADDAQTTTDSPGVQSIDIDSILRDIRKRDNGGARTAVRFPTMRTAEDSTDAVPPVDAQLLNDPPAEELDEKQLLQEVLSTVRELTSEVKQLRTLIESRPPDRAANTDGKSEPEKPAKKNKVLSVISSVLFYAVIVAMVLGAFLMRSTSEGKPFMIAGFSAANVLTSSMADVYPQGSLIITKQVDASELQIGDDITFMVSEDSSITHRIIGITENYQGTGARAFRTQGTKNANPDKEPVVAANVVGKVIFHSKELGDFANFVKDNWPILIFVLVVVVALISFLKWNAKRTDEDDEPKDKPKKKKTRLNTKKQNILSERRNESNGDE